MKKRYIFDLDGTLLNGDYSEIRKYFIDQYGEEAIPFLDSMPDILSRYEKNFTRYNYEMLGRFLKMKTGLDMDEKTIREWDQLLREIPDTEEKHARETLEYLKQQGNDLVVLTNWFGPTQSERLRRADLLQYFDKVYGGELATKPHKEAYMNAASCYARSICVFVGDNAVTDYVGPRSYSFDSILYDKDDRFHKSLVKIKRLDELKRR